jgi:serine/threonine-protein kinase
MTGRPLGSRFLLVEQIGRGATGTVWRGLDRDTGERVAVKLLRQELLAEPKAVARFVQEREVLRRLRHENVVRVRDLVSEGDVLALVMDLVEGTDLRGHLRRAVTLPPAHAAALLAQVSDALAAAHAAGVVHRDLKPDNILLEPAGGDELRARLTDFGIARVLETAGITTSSVIVGTPNYLAPEVVNGAEPTPAIDVYALGIVLYELVVGRAPFAGGPPITILRRHLESAARRRDGMPDPLWALIRRCLDKDGLARPGATELADDLRAVARETAGAPALAPLPRTAHPLATHLPLAAGPSVGLLDTSGAAALLAAVRAEDRARAVSGGAAPGGGTAGAAVTGGLPAPGDWPGGAGAARPGATRRRRLLTHGAVSASVAMLALLTPVLTGWRPFTAGELGQSQQNRSAALPDPARSGTAGPSAPAVTHSDRTSEPPPVSGGGPLPPPRPDSSATAGGADVRSDPQGAPGPADVSRGATEPRLSQRIGPGVRPLSWRCSDYAWSFGHPAAVRPCYGLGDRTVYIKGEMLGPPGMRADVILTLQDVDSETTVAGPFVCPDLTFTEGARARTCGRFATRPPRGHRYVVVQTWRYPDLDEAPRGRGRSGAFTW